MKLTDAITTLTAINAKAKEDGKHVSFADVIKVTVEFEDDINLVLKPKGQEDGK
jgi:hypothetical protein